MRRSHCILLGLLLGGCFPAAGHAVGFLELLNDLGRWQGIGCSEGYHACRPDAPALQPPWHQHLGSHRGGIGSGAPHAHPHGPWAPRPMDRLPIAPAPTVYQPSTAPSPALPFSAPAPPPEKTALPEQWKNPPERSAAPQQLPPIAPSDTD